MIAAKQFALLNKHFYDTDLPASNEKQLNIASSLWLQENASLWYKCCFKEMLRFSRKGDQKYSTLKHNI